jgi:mannose-1-phosphate guanylyltransferase/MurNAc alpha-1-phosphate uridylyltransferase
MADSVAGGVAGVVLAAGAGERLRPLTWLRPKVLCPVAGVALLDVNLARVAGVLGIAGVGGAAGLVGLAGSLAVNGHHHLDLLAEHLSTRHPEVHLSEEPDRPLGTAGAIGRLRAWLDGRAAVVVNGDAWTDVPLAPLLDGWDGERVRVLVPGGTDAARLGAATPVAGTLLPGPVAAGLGDEPSGLYAEVWAPAASAGRLELVAGSGRFVDCGTPASYLAANMAGSGGAPVVGDGAVVEAGAELTRTVVWPGAVVTAGEVLVDAIRADQGVTVLVRRIAGSGRPG